MFFRLLLLFTLIPLVELYVLLALGRLVGLPWTLALVFATGILGAALARSQGVSTWRRLQEKIAAGQSPAESLIDGLLILVAGAVLLTPGLLTDIAGFALLVPITRRLVRKAVHKAVQARLVRVHAAGGPGVAGSATRGGAGPVIVVEDFRPAGGSEAGDPASNDPDAEQLRD
ncbi:MAG: FxsA family protein [Acidobacteriota bacterium]